MMPMLLLSNPGPTWRIRGGENFKSRTRAKADPGRAAEEWSRLRDAIVAAGAEVLVLPPPAVDPPLTGLVYTANIGAMLGDTFVLAQMTPPHRQPEGEHVRAFLKERGIRVERIDCPWEGQAEITPLPGERYILTYGVRSVAESADFVAERLPEGAGVLRCRLREPFFHGDTCLLSMATPTGHVLLVHEDALVDTDLDTLRAFADGVDVIPISEADALGYACNALPVGDTWIVPRGLSAGLLGNARRRGMNIVELDLGELFGKGGGGPRCLINELTAPPARR